LEMAIQATPKSMMVLGTLGAMVNATSLPHFEVALPAAAEVTDRAAANQLPTARFVGSDPVCLPAVSVRFTSSAMMVYVPETCPKPYWYFVIVPAGMAVPSSNVAGAVKLAVTGLVTDMGDSRNAKTRAEAGLGDLRGQYLQACLTVASSSLSFKQSLINRELSPLYSTPKRRSRAVTPLGLNLTGSIGEVVNLDDMPKDNLQMRNGPICLQDRFRHCLNFTALSCSRNTLIDDTTQESSDRPRALIPSHPRCPRR